MLSKGVWEEDPKAEELSEDMRDAEGVWGTVPDGWGLSETVKEFVSESQKLWDAREDSVELSRGVSEDTSEAKGVCAIVPDG